MTSRRSGFPRTALLCAATVVAGAATGLAGAADSDCSTPQPTRPLPDPAVCLQRAGVVAAASPAATAEALFAQGEQRIAAGRFDDADAALDCADAVLAAGDDAPSRYELVRRRAILDYRRERIPEALSGFECALRLSSAREDRAATARDLRNVGSAQRRLGDYHGALGTLIRSLDMQRAIGEVDGAVLNNLADVYRALEEPADAMRYYREALAAYRARGKPIEAAHVLESMAELSLDTGDVRQATAWLREALQTYRDGEHRAYALRVYGGLIRAALASGDLAQAGRDAGGALALAQAHRLPLPAALQLQLARYERATGAAPAALRRVREALAATARGDADRPALLEEMSAIQASTGDPVAALVTLGRAHAEADALSRAQHDRQLGWLRTRFETAERDRTIAALETENRLRRAELRQRTLLLWLTLAVAVSVALLIWTGLQRRRQRERLLAATQRVRDEAELARYRREAEALAEDRSLLQTLLDSREDAVCLLDAEGRVLAANRAACTQLGIDLAGPVAPLLADALAVADRPALVEALERMEDAVVQTVPVTAVDGGPLRAHLSPWSGGDGLVVLALGPEAPEPMTDPAEAPPPAADSGAREEAGEDAREDFRRALVELMLALVEAWERSTGTSRLELAEKSRLWRVTIDDGRLRARAMERYLSLSKLPRNPRWRDVLRSAYHVLGHCPLDAEARAALQARVDAVLAYTRRDALV